MTHTSNKYIYLIVSGTNTLLGKLIQKKLGVCYNHSSISLDENLEKFYSFGRKELWHIFSAGFVHESKSSGFFKKYCHSKVVVLKIAVTDTQWANISNALLMFEREQSNYKYSLLGLVYCYFGIATKRKNKYFCSQFVAEILNLSGLFLFDKPESLVRPHDFLKLSQSTVIYNGEIGQYAMS